MIIAALLFAATTAVPSDAWKATLDDYKTNLAAHNVEKTFLDAAMLDFVAIQMVAPERQCAFRDCVGGG